MPENGAVGLLAVEPGGRDGDFHRSISLITERGPVECHYYPCPGARLGAVFVGGVGGGFDTPAQGLYPRLCREFIGEGLASLRVRYRHPAVLDEAVHDVLAGLAFLEIEGVRAVALTGHSFGGAVVIQAAARSRLVRAVAALATQSQGADPVRDLGGRCPVLLIHGRDDERLPAACSEQVYRMAGQPKRLRLLAGAGHSLDQVAAAVRDELRAWIPNMLRRAGGA